MNAPHPPHPSYPPNTGAYGSYPPPNQPPPFAPYPPPPRRGMSPWIFVLAGVMLLGLGTCGGLVGLMVLGNSMEDGGVMFGAQIPDAKKAKLRERGLLRESDQLIAFYDGSISLDMSEVSILTADRLVRAQGNHVATVPLANVTSIDHRVENVIGDVIEVGTDKGERLRIEVAHLNNGISFLNAIEDEVRKKQPNVIVHREKPR